MSQYDSQYLHDHVRVGYTDRRGDAWWNRSGVTSTGEPNHFTGPVPVNVARELLTSDPAIALPFRVTIPEYLGPDGVTDKRHVTVPGRIAVVGSRSGNVWGVFRDSYTIHALDAVLLDGVADLIGESRGDLSIGSVGLLKYGAVGWLQLESPENLTTRNGVEFRPHLLATTSHDGTLATTYTRCSTVVVCDNTYTAAMGEGADRVKVKHSKHSALHLGDAREALGILADTGAEFAAEVEALSRVKVSAPAFSRFVTSWAPMPEDPEKNKRAVTVAENKRATLTDLWKSDPRVSPWKGTGWGVVQAVNTYGIHFAALRNGSDDEARNAAERFDRATLAAADGTMGAALASTRDLLTSVL